LSINDLAKHAKKVYQALRQGDINLARKRVGEMVGRDTEDLSESEILRATVESVAENSVDGVISPLFYAFLGGAPLALAYKAINTLDSMVGYKSERYLYFGWFSAKLDDLANFLPARISALLIPLVAFLLMRKGKDSLRIILRDGKKSPSPNAGIPEAGFAGALGRFCLLSVCLCFVSSTFGVFGLFEVRCWSVESVCRLVGLPVSRFIS